MKKRKINWKHIQQEYNGGMSIRQLSKKYKLSSVTFSDAVKVGLLKTRTLGEALKLRYKQNPNSNPMKQISSREKVRKTVMERVRNGTWHNSFSKSRTHIYKGIKLYGKWEVAYAMWLDDNDIEWRRPKESFVYEFGGSDHRYTPDFYLIQEGVYVEVKGYKTEKDEAKWSQFPLKLKVLMGEDLHEMGLITSYKKIQP